MNPVRQGDGVGLSAAGFSEVREGDGTVLWSQGGAIPDLGLDHLWWGPQIDDISQDWLDQEGSLSATPFNSPSLGSINTYQSVDYTASNDEYHATSSAIALGTNDEYTIAGVCQADSFGSSTRTMFSDGAGSDGVRFVILNDGSWVLGHSGVDATGGGSVDSDPHVFVATYDGSSAIVDIDGSNVINAALDSPAAPSGGVYIAQRGDGSEDYDGDIGAVGFESAAADQTRRDELTDKLGDAFDIPVST